MKTIIISGFPGIGKTHFKENSDLCVLDSDSSKFNKSEFPENYITHIKENIGKVDIILVSSHETVRNALVDNDIDFTLVFPVSGSKDIYLDRYMQRGSPPAFIDLISKNWDSWIEDLKNQRNCDRYQLKRNRFLSDIIHEIQGIYKMIGNLTNTEWEELCGLEYAGTQYPTSLSEDEWKRYEYLRDKK